MLVVAFELNRLGLIWRETPMSDIGIDGQVEFVDSSGHAVGRLAAAQVKSGESYMRDGGSEWRFYPEEKHRLYWERFPLPVLLFLHAPRDGSVYWVDVRQALRSPERSSLTYLGVPKENRLQDADAELLFRTVGASAQPFLPLVEVLDALIGRVSPGRHFPVSYFDLFANGLTNLRRSLYYGMDLAMEVAEELVEPAEDGGAFLRFGPEVHEYLFGFVQFLVEQHLAEIDLSDCLIDWYERQMQPRFIAPLTSRGRALVALIDEKEKGLMADGSLNIPAGIHVAQEAFLHVELNSSHYERIWVIREFQRILGDSPPQ